MLIVQGDDLPIIAETFHKKWASFSRPVLVGCDDLGLWVVKGPQPQNKRAICNEQVVARLGRLLQAPVCDVEIVALPAELCSLQPELADVSPGLSHGVRFVPDCTDRETVKHWDQPQNRARFAALQVLYTWTHAGDHQLIYSMSPPNLVYSVDHGHFFPGGPDWTPASLAAAGPVSTLDPIFGVCGLTPEELATVAPRLLSIDRRTIDSVCAVPPDDWGLALSDRTALADFLEVRRVQLAALLCHQ